MNTNYCILFYSLNLHRLCIRTPQTYLCAPIINVGMQAIRSFWSPGGTRELHCVIPNILFKGGTCLILVIHKEALATIYSLSKYYQPGHWDATATRQNPCPP